ncbi:MAG: flagellin [bacterium]
MPNYIAQAQNLLSDYYTVAAFNLRESLFRLGTGLRVNKPSDDFGSWQRANSFDTKIRSIAVINRGIDEAREIISTAETEADEIIDMLNEMAATALSASTTVDQNSRNALQTKFKQLVTDFTAWYPTLTDPATGDHFFDGNYSRAVKLDESTTYTMNNITDLDGIDDMLIALDFYTAGAPSQANATDAYNAIKTGASGIPLATSAAGVVASYSSTLNAAYNVNDSASTNLEAAKSTFIGLDEAEELAAYTEYEIRQQTTLAMLNSASTFRTNVLALFTKYLGNHG